MNIIIKGIRISILIFIFNLQYLILEIKNKNTKKLVHFP